MLPVAFPAAVVVLIEVDVKRVKAVVVCGSKEVAAFIAVGLVYLENSALVLAVEDRVELGVNSQKEELFARNILLFQSSSSINPRLGHVYPSIHHSSIRWIHDSNRRIPSSSPHLVVSRDKQLVVKVIHRHILTLNSCRLIAQLNQPHSGSSRSAQLLNDAKSCSSVRPDVISSVSDIDIIVLVNCHGPSIGPLVAWQ